MDINKKCRHLQGTKHFSSKLYSYTVLEEISLLFQIAASPEITSYLHEWDLGKTEDILKKLEEEQSMQKEEEDKFLKQEKER